MIKRIICWWKCHDFDVNDKRQTEYTKNNVLMLIINIEVKCKRCNKYIKV